MLADHNAIAARGLTRHYGEVAALSDFDLDVPAGTIMGLLGPNGAGKTTAVRILATILQPDAGSASVGGHDVVDERQAVRACIGLAGQNAAVDEDLTGFENLALVGQLAHMRRRAAITRSRELLERFELDDAADRPVKTYSGGMQRRLDLAAALVHDPPILFLDEPTTGLDPRSRGDVWELIRELVGEGTTLLLTTQYLEEADHLADRIVVIDEGRRIAEGTPAGLKADLGASIIEVELTDQPSARRARRLLAGVGDSPPRVVGATVELPTANGRARMMDVLRLLDREGVEPAGLALREPSLDDVFLSLTGHRATTTGSADGPAAAVPATMP